MQETRGVAALLGQAGSGEDASMDAEASPSQQQRARRGGPRTEGGDHPKTYFASQFMQPEWMTDVPSDLGANWFVMARPEGRRVLLVSSGGRTVSRTRTGAVLHRMTSSLPEGSAASLSGSDACILDCVYHEADRTYYAQDLLMWRGHSFYDCTAEFRIAWLQAKLAEEAYGAGGGVCSATPRGDAMEAKAGTSGCADGDGGGGGGGGVGRHRLVLSDASPSNAEGQSEPYHLVALTAAVADATGLAAAHGVRTPFVKDGLYLLHKEGHYQAVGPPCPLALLWKDAACSTYLLDTDPQGVTLERQLVTLEFRMDGTVATEDDPPVVLGQLPQSFVEANAQHLRPGRLLRFTLGDGGLTFHEGRPAGADLRYEGPGNQRRGRADTFSKIMFQYNARRQTITIEALMQCASHPALGVEEDMA
ncbi:hypothetical protein FOA52_010766 [Chlamydomonas sp. UWO 241]|nr:hypothetical protein FOA52_010766 [Chlamydomonas sp. UWO 241]